MKVLLTGSQGLVGSNIKDLCPPSIELLTPNLDELNLLNFKNVYEYINKTKAELIIHAAGIVGGIQANIENPVKFLTENTLIANNLIIAAKENQVQNLINLGSSCMYPKSANNPLSEDLILTGELEPTNEGYAIAKIYAQRLCSYINKEAGNSNYKTFIPCNLYGRGDKFDLKWSHMIPAVIRKLYEAKIAKSSQVTIWGDGTARREFMFAGDLADFIWYAVEQIDQIPELLNVGLEYDHSILEYYEVISEVIGYRGSFEFDLSKPIGMKQKKVDIQKLKTLGWSPKHSLEDGINETYNYFINEILKFPMSQH
jgi:GDP-L-fucose synthase